MALPTIIESRAQAIDLARRERQQEAELPTNGLTFYPLSDQAHGGRIKHIAGVIQTDVLGELDQAAEVVFKVFLKVNE
ncbi:hypothetical protein SAMN05421780_12411 [Flexibacter flexilis DSM 6793]|uniref:Uncharacterized protein n=1 Tax=Flexibacter flexilis DSM 6793 TaxID=927664 RepID=A0A1I1NYV1_9BACT|nr:hypothetical protein [Flexibacter flexilis]SFD02645.1 hypothetical protein SAMN05421780_12411 [Flexibacter flexilis DSM 6793]